MTTTRVDALDWDDLTRNSTTRGFAVTAAAARRAANATALAALFDDGRFRSTIDMARHRFGDGRYRYFEHPLPPLIGELRSGFYARLAPVANDWATRIGGDRRSRSPTRSCSSAASRTARRARRR